MTEEPLTKVEARQGDRKTLNRNVLVWGLGLVIVAFIIGFFLA